MDAWVFMMANSSGVSFPGLLRISLEMAILPTSCSAEAFTTSARNDGVRSGCRVSST